MAAVPDLSQPPRAGTSFKVPETIRRVLRASSQFLFTVAIHLEYGILEQQNFVTEVLKAERLSCCHPEGPRRGHDENSAYPVPYHLTYPSAPSASR